jgi:uncharacterized repeat protein (TIGR01451 family)
MQTRRTIQKRTVRWLSRWMMFGALLTLIIPAGAWADGTASGLSIDNQATISYQVSGVDQTAVESSPTGNSTPGAGNGSATSFLVDNVVRVVVASVANTAVAPLQTNAALAFTVTNTGNTTQGYRAAVVNGTTNIPMTNVHIVLDANGNGLYDTGEVTYGNNAYIQDLAADAVMHLLIVADAPNATQATDGDRDTYWLQVTTLTAGGGAVEAETRVGAVDDPAAVDVVFDDAASDDGGAIDAANNGQHADSGDFYVATAAMSVQKTAVVVEDPVLGVSANAKAIPGARVTYTITIRNTGGTAASNVAITDDIPAHTAYVAGSATLNSTPQPDSGGAVTLTGSPATNISVAVGAIAGGATATVTFDVTIN